MNYDRYLWKNFLPLSLDENAPPFEKSGVLIIDKPCGLSSMDVLRFVKKVGRIKKAGHAGTLDPMATGVLPVLILKATSLSNRLMEGSKEYEGVIDFGQEYDTQDVTGSPVGNKIENINLNLTELNLLASRFVGEISQIPPIFSAIKKNGKPLYDYARSSRNIEIEPRKVTVHRFDILELLSPYQASFYVSCEKGVYVRTLVHDLGKLTSLGAALSSLRRLRVGKFNIENSVSLENLQNQDEIAENLIDLEDVVQMV